MQTLVLHIRDVSTTQTKWEDSEGEIPKEEEPDLPPGTLRATALPSIVLARRVVPGSRLEGLILPPVHTYSVRHVNEDDFNEDDFKSGAKRNSELKENIHPVKRRKL